MAAERTIPPAGEEIHLPGGSLQPILVTVGTTLALVGITISTWLLIAGIVLTVVVSTIWIRDAIHEYRELPADHHPGTHDSAPDVAPHH